MKKTICFILVIILALSACVACSNKKSTENVEKHTVTIYRSSISPRGVASTSKMKTITVEDGEVIGQIDKGFATARYEFKGFFTEKTAVEGQEWNPAKDEVHSDLEIYAVWEYKSLVED